MPDGAQPLALPDGLDFEHARLPAAYRSARVALAECEQLDECVTWANKAEALASYARQMNDSSLREMCDRIQARAVRRAGELLLKVPPNPGRPATEIQEGALPNLSRTAVADAAGLSEHQRKTAIRVARVPSGEFEDAVERPNPITVTALADRGRQERPPPTEDYRQATHLAGLLHRFMREAGEIDITAARRGLEAHEIAVVKTHVKAAWHWLSRVDEALLL